MIDRMAFPPELALRPKEAQLASLFVEHERVSSKFAFAALYGHQSAPPDTETLKVHVSYLRKKFGRLDLKIETLWGWGWKMPAEDRARLKGLIRINTSEGVAP